MESTRPKAPVDAVHRRSRGWRRRVERRGMTVLIRTRIVSRIVITVVKMTRGVSDGWRMTQRERENRVPPDILANSTAAYLYRPERKVVTIQDKIQTATNDLEDSAAEEDVAGMRRTRRVERWRPKAYPLASPPIPPSRSHENLRFFLGESKAPGSEE